jgi:cyclohexyl-isocyanide hydratase
MNGTADEKHLEIGGIIFPGMDQFDFTGPFEVLSRVPNSTFHVIGRDAAPVRDARGLWLTPEKTFAQAPKLDVLLVPGGAGQFDLMEDEETLNFLRARAMEAAVVFSVCTGSLTLGAAGLLRGVKCTTHWAAFDVLEHFEAVPVNERVVIDGKFVSAAGVSSGIDGALRVAAILRGERAAQEIQLYMQYAPEPPFAAGDPAFAPPDIVESIKKGASEFRDKRIALARQIAAKWPKM